MTLQPYEVLAYKYNHITITDTETSGMVKDGCHLHGFHYNLNLKFRADSALKEYTDAFIMSHSMANRDKASFCLVINK